jgi:DNA-3-methyladenine glycosylase II
MTGQAAAVADPEAREFLRKADPVLARLIDVRATRAILGRLEQHFGGRLPSPAELLAVDPQVLRDSGMSARKGTTLRA